MNHEHRRPTGLPRTVVCMTSIALAAASVWAADSLVCVGERQASFGDVHQFSTVRHTFTIRNDSDHPVAIVTGIAVSGTGRVTFDPATIRPGDTTTVEASQPVGDDLGTTAYRFAVVTDEPFLTHMVVTLARYAGLGIEMINVGPVPGNPDPVGFIRRLGDQLTPG